VLFPAGLLSVVASRRNDAVQDVVVGTAVIDDWVYPRVTGGVCRCAIFPRTDITLPG